MQNSKFHWSIIFWSQSLSTIFQGGIIFYLIPFIPWVWISVWQYLSPQNCLSSWTPWVNIKFRSSRSRDFFSDGAQGEKFVFQADLRSGRILVLDILQLSDKGEGFWPFPVLIRVVILISLLGEKKVFG